MRLSAVFLVRTRLPFCLRTLDHEDRATAAATEDLHDALLADAAEDLNVAFELPFPRPVVDIGVVLHAVGGPRLEAELLGVPAAHVVGGRHAETGEVVTAVLAVDLVVDVAAGAKRLGPSGRVPPEAASAW